LNSLQPCPCGGKSYASCCEPFHLGKAIAPTPEKLMRSRYSAYVMKLEAYLLSTWHPDTCPEEPLFQDQPSTQWVDLKIKHHSMAADQLSGTVEFVAVFKVNGKAHRIHEISQFIKQNDRWFYVDGEFPEIK
jgi:SEC-C motif-containing protein